MHTSAFRSSFKVFPLEISLIGGTLPACIGGMWYYKAQFFTPSSLRWLLTLLVVLPNVALASEVCVTGKLAYRTGKEFCWARYELDLKREICIPRATWKKWLQLTFPRPWCVHSDQGQVKDSQVNERWKSYSPPENPMGHISKDSSKYIRFRQTLKEIPILGDSKSLRLRWIHGIERIRERTSDLLDRAGDSYRVFHSLAVHQSDPDLHFLRKLGFVHLLSATGIHLYALWDWIHWLLKKVCSFEMISVTQGQRLARFLSLLFCAFVWLLNGARLGMLRPWLILMMKVFAKSLGFQWRRGAPLFCALVLEVGAMFFYEGSFYANHPAVTGRLLYALAIGGGLLFYESIPTKIIGVSIPYFLRSHLGLAVGSWILVTYWDVWNGANLTIATPLVSLLTLPLTCLITYPLLISAIVMNELSFGHTAETVIRFLSNTFYPLLIKTLELTLLPGNIWSLSPIYLLVGMTLALILLSVSYVEGKVPRTLRRIALAIVIVTLLIKWISVNSLEQLPSGKKSSVRNGVPLKSPGWTFWGLGGGHGWPSISEELFLPEGSPTGNHVHATQVEQLDVGQGDAALVHGADGTFGMIDTGSQKALSEEAWLNFFASRKIHKLQWIALTHLDEDHFGGLYKIAKIIPIECVAILAEELSRVPISIPGLTFVNWEYDCIPFPHTSIHKKTKANANGANANMGAVFVPFAVKGLSEKGMQGGFYLSAGDATAEGEKELLQWIIPLVDSMRYNKEQARVSRIVKISHHGSKTSTDPQWIERLSPTEVWISVGKGNRYGHPHSKVLTFLKDKKIPIHRTDQQGLIKN